MKKCPSHLILKRSSRRIQSHDLDKLSLRQNTPLKRSNKIHDVALSLLLQHHVALSLLLTMMKIQLELQTSILSKQRTQDHNPLGKKSCPEAMHMVWTLVLYFLKWQVNRRISTRLRWLQTTCRQSGSFASCKSSLSSREKLANLYYSTSDTK